jgi:hypothetical protein
MTTRQLDHAGYHTTNGRLPPPAGCYRDSQSMLVMLYDPQQAVKKRAARRTSNVCVSEVFWPLDCIPMLDMILSFKHRNDAEYMSYLRDVACMAFHVLVFTPDEIKHNAGGYTQLTIPPMLVNRSYTRFLSRPRYVEKLGRSIVKVYESQLR